MKIRNGVSRLTPGIRTMEYISDEQTRRANDEKRTEPPTIEKDGSQEIEAPNLDGSLQSHMPMAAMRERCREPMVRTGACNNKRCRRLKIWVKRIIRSSSIPIQFRVAHRAIIVDFALYSYKVIQRRHKSLPPAMPGRRNGHEILVRLRAMVCVE